MSSIRAAGRFLDRASPWIAISCIILGFVVLHNQGHELHATEKALAATQAQLVRSQKESTATRVTTVTQRCDLTRKVLEVLVKDDPSRVPAFRASYASCQAQLEHVIAINRRAPTPGGRSR